MKGRRNVALWASGEIAAGCRRIDRVRGQQSPLPTEDGIVFLTVGADADEIDFYE